jgi:hypothetical protein
MNIERFLLLLAGAATIVVGILVVVFRTAVARHNQANIAARFGRAHPGFAKKSTPLKIAIVGTFLVPVGVSMVVKSLAG